MKYASTASVQGPVASDEGREERRVANGKRVDCPTSMAGRGETNEPAGLSRRSADRGSTELAEVRDKPGGSYRLKPAARQCSHVTTRHASLATLFLLLLAAPGCASGSLFGLKSVKFDRADAKNPAVQILALWQASEGPGQNGVPTRGFAAQIFFFTQAKPAPVVVDGKVRIYLFDDRGTVKQQGRPIGEFDFDPVVWNAHAHASTLGPGYAVFIPYPRADFHQASCSLRIRFIPNVGPTIYSPTASVVLTGPPTKPVEADQIMIPSSQARQQGPQTVNPARQPSTVGPFNAGPTSLPPSAAYSSPAQPGGLPADAGGLPMPRVSFTPNVVPVAGTDTDARLSLEDDVAAPDAGSTVRTAPLPEEATASRSGRMKLQSAPVDPSDRDEE